MHILVGLWPNTKGSGMVAIRKILPAPSMIPAEEGMLFIPELGKEVLVRSKIAASTDPEYDCELRCVADPEDIRKLEGKGSGWKRVQADPCPTCPHS